MGGRGVANLPHHKIKQICSDWSLGRPNAVALLHFQTKVVNAVRFYLGVGFHPCVISWNGDPAATSCPEPLPRWHLESPVARSRCADDGIIIMSSYHMVTEGRDRIVSGGCPARRRAGESRRART